MRGILSIVKRRKSIVSERGSVNEAFLQTEADIRVIDRAIIETVSYKRKKLSPIDSHSVFVDLTNCSVPFHRPLPFAGPLDAAWYDSCRGYAAILVSILALSCIAAPLL